MNKTNLLLIGGGVIALMVGLGIWFATSLAPAPTESLSPSAADELRNPQMPVGTPSLATSTAETSMSFQPQTFTATKAAHFVSSEPANNAILTVAFTSVTINFNFDLAPPSKISVTRDGGDVTAGQTTIAPGKLSMSVPVNADQTGNYQVNYTACWPDKSCHNGSFGFSVQLAP